MTALEKISATVKWLHDHVGYSGDGCLTWPWSCDTKGYAQLKYGDKVRKAHRIMCTLAHGEPPTPKHQASHTCGNGHQGCVNPRHLAWKTNSENQLDRRRHGRPLGNPYGAEGKLTPDQIKQIQAAAGIVPIERLAIAYGVKRGAIDYWHRKARERAA